MSFSDKRYQMNFSFKNITHVYQKKILSKKKVDFENFHVQQMIKLSSGSKLPWDKAEMYTPEISTIETNVNIPLKNQLVWLHKF